MGGPKVTPYGTQIRQLAPSHDPRHVEAYMRLEHGTLDRLSPRQFAADVKMAVACIDADPAMAERLAQSYGF